MNLVPHLTSPHSVYPDMCRKEDDRDLMSSLFPYNRDCWHTYVWSTIHQVVTCYRYEHKSIVYISSILCFYIKNMTKDIKKREYFQIRPGDFWRFVNVISIIEIYLYWIHHFVWFWDRHSTRYVWKWYVYSIRSRVILKSRCTILSEDICCLAS